MRHMNRFLEMDISIGFNYSLNRSHHRIHLVTQTICRIAFTSAISYLRTPDIGKAPSFVLLRFLFVKIEIPEPHFGYFVIRNFYIGSALG